MTRNGKVLAGAATILILGSAAAVAHRYGAGHADHHRGWRGAPGIMGLTGPLCRGNAAERADHMLVRLEYKLQPTDAQKAAFEDLKTAVKSAAVKVAAACPVKSPTAADGGGDQVPVPKDITARLAEAEAQLTAALEGVKVVRPAAEKLYASLDDAQKKAISEFGADRHAMHGRHHEKWKHSGGEGETGRGMPRDDGPADR